MQYLFDSGAGAETLCIRDESYRYLFKARRHKIDDILALRNLKDDFLYIYKIENISRKEALLILKDKKELVVKPSKFFHLGWCMVDPKTIEKTLPMLNELGVSKISFIYCQRSQKNFKINFQRLNKIALNSSQQCGRSVMMEFEEIKCIEKFLEIYPNSVILDFGGESIKDAPSFSTIIVGCEGGFSENEKKFFTNKMIYKLDTSMILKSESAAVAVSVMQELG